MRSSTGSDATFFQLYSVLSDVTELSFSAEFTGVRHCDTVGWGWAFDMEQLYLSFNCQSGGGQDKVCTHVAFHGDVYV